MVVRFYLSAQPKTIMTRSRLIRKIEEKTKKNLALSILGIILTVFIMFKFGLPFLINLSLFLSGSKNNQEFSKSKNSSFIAPPVLNPFPQATSSANIAISGIGSKDQTISLYVNDELINKVKAQDDGTFSFKETVKHGENIIKVRAIENDKESEFSNSITTVFKNSLPTLNINSPSDGQSFSKDQNAADVKGITDADNRITVNGFWAIIDESGNFSYKLPLRNGENLIKVIATDIAGNKTEKEIRITYSP